LAATLLVIAATVVLPFTPLGRILGFCPLPAPFWCLIATVVLAYIVAAEFMKRWFYRHVAF
jgi:Mg2+-importing ATPase